MPRYADAVLADWWSSSGRKPLVLQGARQTGKSSAVRAFGRTVELFVELDLERPADRRLVTACETLDDLLVALRARANVARFPERTLLFFDEVQECPEAVRWLRFLHEHVPSLRSRRRPVRRARGPATLPWSAKGR
jgi:predicted AAA+ superfamily ATPase